MEVRIARLEADMEHVKRAVDRLDRGQEALRSDTGTLKVDLAKLATRVDHLPSKGFVVTATSTTIAVIGAIVVFADKLRALIGG